MYQAPEAEVLSAVRRIKDDLSAAYPDSSFDRDAEEYLTTWKTNTDESPAWFGARRSETGEPMLHLLPATKNIMSFAEGMTINKSMISVEAINDFTDFISETADRIDGRVDDRKAAIEAKIRKLQGELDQLNTQGIAPLDDRERQVRANKFRKMIIDIRNGVGEIPDALKALSEKSFEALFSSQSKGSILNEVGRLRSEFRNEAPYQIMTSLRQTHLNREKRLALEDSIKTVVDGVHEYMTIDDHRHSQSFFSHVINIGAKHIEREGVHQATILEFINSRNFVEQQTEAIAFRDAKSMFQTIADVIEPSAQDSRLRNVGLRITDRSTINAPEHTRRRLSGGPTPPKERSMTQNVRLQDMEKAAAESAERNAENFRMSKIMSKETVRLRLDKQLESRTSISISEYLERYPLEYGLSQFHIIIEEAFKQVPARFTPGRTVKVRIPDGDSIYVLESADFDFLKEGQPGEGLAEFAMQFSADQLYRLEGPDNHQYNGMQ